jgi:endoglucanase
MPGGSRAITHILVLSLWSLLGGTFPLSAQTAVAQQDSSARAPETIALRRLAHLRHGVNLSGWFAQVSDPKGYTREHFSSHTTPRDIALIKAMGFDHVRLSINPQPMFQQGEADAIPPEYLGFLDEAVRNVLANGLAVILDIHPGRDFKNKLATDDSFVEQFADFWRAFAKHYASFDPNLVFFEMLNEPEMQDRYRWAGMQAKLAATIRAAAPQNTIIATGAHWSADDDLLFMEPLSDANVIYSFISTSRTSSPTRERTGGWISGTSSTGWPIPRLRNRRQKWPPRYPRQPIACT